MKTALLSDVHANLEALEAVFKVAAERRVGRILCLGDVVGYGASPNECLNLIREHSQMVLLGNHDSAASGGGEAARFNPNAKAAALWTAKVLTPQNRDFLRALSLSRHLDPYFYVHASPAAPRDWNISSTVSTPSLSSSSSPSTPASSATRTSRRSSSAPRRGAFRSLRPSCGSIRSTATS